LNIERSHFYIFSGLPGVGKTTLAKALSSRLKAVYLRVDTVEQGLIDLCNYQVEGEGYRLSYRVASDNLEIGNIVVSDSCNPISLTRREWQEVASTKGIPYTNIEVVCSDIEEHRNRIESRVTDIDGLILPNWQQVVEREYEQWESERVEVDTTSRKPEESVIELLGKLNIAT
jgi:predicted kinase